MGFRVSVRWMRCKDDGETAHRVAAWGYANAHAAQGRARFDGNPALLA